LEEKGYKVLRMLGYGSFGASLLAKNM